MPDPRWYAEGSGYTVTRRPGKARPARMVSVRDDGSDGTIRSGRPSEAAGRERSKANATRKSNPGQREGLGEGDIEDQADEIELEDGSPF